MQWNEEFLEERCIPRSRAGLREYLETLVLEEYDPVEIIKKPSAKWWKIINGFRLGERNDSKASFQSKNCGNILKGQSGKKGALQNRPIKKHIGWPEKGLADVPFCVKIEL